MKTSAQVAAEINTLLADNGLVIRGKTVYDPGLPDSTTYLLVVPKVAMFDYIRGPLPDDQLIDSCNVNI